MLKDLASLIIRHTVPSRYHLTPELVFRLITPSSPLWGAREDEVPFKDPFWAFYWPGGQATARSSSSTCGSPLLDVGLPQSSPLNPIFGSTHPVAASRLAQIVAPPGRRYILDNGDLVKNRRVLDIGCGCGAGAIAAAKMEAKYVLANDIDSYAIAATRINSELNRISVKTSSDDFIGTKCEDFDTILIGDMFYDEQFANVLFGWLQKLSRDGKTVLIGDPGRHGLTASRIANLTLLASYKMPEHSCIENHGFTHTTFWMLNK